jgi:hypothetical protein
VCIDEYSIIPYNSTSNPTVFQVYINNIWLKCFDSSLVYHQAYTITLKVQYIIRLFRANRIRKAGHGQPKSETQYVLFNNGGFNTCKRGYILI